MKNIKLSLIAALPLVAVFAASIASAQTVTVSTSASGGAQAGGVKAALKADLETAAKTRIIDRADQEIERRIKIMTADVARIQDLKRVSADGKANLTADLQKVMSDLATLKAKIDADTDLATLKTDVKSITASYRVFMLVMPKERILTAADRINVIASAMTTLSGKLQARISAAQTAGKDVSAATAAMADLNAKIADANAKAKAAVDLVTPLTPDNGDQTKAAANRSALMQARDDIKAGMADLKAARQDVTKVLQILKDFHLNASSTVSASSSAH